uniref:Uncharacterized protein n=1 Tax=viral metagenome TaxID=1070528 RepID=A0A6C0IRE3_9ZZZZ
MKISNYKIQTGGLEPLLKVPNFKYTFNLTRKLFIGYVYPYADYFINSITNIPFEQYSYTGNTEYINYEDDVQTIQPCNSTNSPVYILTGGSVYEVLNKKFNNIDLYDYCDATGDIDVSLYPPKLTTDLDAGVKFLSVDGKITSFYSNFTTWVFQNMVKNIKSIQTLFINEQGFVNFDIEDYQDIPSKYKHSDFGYNIERLGKFYVVAFLNDDKTMFKIQVVCKIQDSNISSIDHVIEIIIPLPEDDPEFCPSDESYKPPSFNTIEINQQKFNVQMFGGLIRDNISAYTERKNIYGKPNQNEFIHKSINHIARLFYLYELIYRNHDVYDFKQNTFNNLLFLYGMQKKKINELKFLYYYKIVDNKFNTIKVDTRFFLNSYLNLIILDNYTYNNFKNQNPDYFVDDNNITNIQKNHNRFIIELFNDDLFEPSGLLTFSETTGGKRRRNTRKSRKIYRKKSRKIRKKI